MHLIQGMTMWEILSTYVPLCKSNMGSPNKCEQHFHILCLLGLYFQCEYQALNCLSFHLMWIRLEIFKCLRKYHLKLGRHFCRLNSSSKILKYDHSQGGICIILKTSGKFQSYTHVALYVEWWGIHKFVYPGHWSA